MEGQQNTRKKVKNSCEMDIDRLSNLPDPIIHHILSLMDTKYAMQTCVLSKKWMHHWTQIHSLDFDYESFYDENIFLRFICRVLLKRKPFNLCKLRFGGRYDRHPSLAADRIVSYAISQNVEELETSSAYLCSQLSELLTLRALKLFDTCVVDSFNFASLTSLCLFEVRFFFVDNDCEHFSGCLNLENLYIEKCHMHNFKIIRISAPRLVNLFISDFIHYQLLKTKLVISAPRLKYFNFSGMYLLVSSLDKSPALDKVKIHMLPFSSSVDQVTEDWKQDIILDMFSMAAKLAHAKSLEISWDLSKSFQGKIVSSNSEAEVVDLNKTP